MSSHRYIRLISGKRFDFRNPKPSQFTLDDLIWSTSHINRFLGHTPIPYNVLHHCCLCHDISVSRGELKPTRKASLGHDLPEGLVGDCPAPLKALVPDYRDLEHSTELVVTTKLKIEYPYPAAVKVADLIALATEMKSFGRPDYKDLPYPPLDVTIRPWTPAKSRQEFMKRWKLYT